MADAQNSQHEKKGYSSTQITESKPGCFHRGGQEDASNQSGMAQKFDYKVLDCFSA